jgi:hypothetical protein
VVFLSILWWKRSSRLEVGFVKILAGVGRLLLLLAIGGGFGVLMFHIHSRIINEDCMGYDGPDPVCLRAARHAFGPWLEAFLVSFMASMAGIIALAVVCLVAGLLFTGTFAAVKGLARWVLTGRF